MPDTSTKSRSIDYLPLDEVRLAPRNPKGHDAAGIRGMIAHHGFVELPAIDERTGRLVAGHGRHEQLTAMWEAGEDPPDGIEVLPDGRWAMPVLRGWSSRSDPDAEAYLLGSNKIGEKGGIADEALLAEMLGDLDHQDLLLLTGFGQTELDDLRAALEEPTPTALPESGGNRERSTSGRDLEGQTRQTRGLDDLADDYAASSVRVLVLAYPGARYVWVVDQLAEILRQRGLENNSDAVLSLLEDLTGEKAPAADALANALDDA
jgi:hypothetical protein